jgi:hypothetical protein
MVTQAQLDALRGAIAHELNMVKHYDSSPKRAQNAALESAGLAPIHSAALFAYDDEQRAKRQQAAAALKSLLDALEGDDAQAEEEEAEDRRRANPLEPDFRRLG